jgi:hypothetical protein
MLLRERCFRIRPSRGKDVVEAFLGEHRPDFWVPDRLAAQMGWAQKADRPGKGDRTTESGRRRYASLSPGGSFSDAMVLSLTGSRLEVQ